MREDWIEIELGKVCFTTSGGTPSRKIPEYYQGNIPWVKSGELNHNVIRDTEEHISEEAVKNSSAKIFPEGTLLIALYGATIGKLAILGIPAATNQAVCGIFKSEIFETKFLFNYLFHKKQKLIEQGAGGAQPNISQTILKRLPVPLAPLPEQRAIVAKIEQLFSELDNGIANLKAAKDKLEIYRQAVLKKAFEGELTKEWRALRQAQGTQNKPDIEPVEMTGLSNNHLPTLPAGWKWVSVKEIAEKIQYGYTESSSHEIIGPKFLRITDIQNNKVNWNTVPYCKIDDDEVKKYILQDGDLVFARTGATVGKSFLIKGNIPKSVFASYLIRLRFPKKNVLDKYVWNFFQSYSYWAQIKKKSVGTGQPNVNGKKLGEILFPLPPPKEQTQIVQEIESRLSVCDHVQQQIDEALEKSEALRQSILNQAFEGKLLSEEELKACRKEPDWEPAEKLLERIKSMKQARISEPQKTS